VGKILPEGSAVKQTLTGRRKRFRAALQDRLAGSGWGECGLNIYRKKLLGGQVNQEFFARLLRIEGKLDSLLENQPAESIAADYVSIKQAAKITELSGSHIRRAVRSGELPASNAGTRQHPVWRIARTDLAGWMEKKKGGHNVPPKPKLKELVNRHLPDLG
jgi:excisionase family DNA binding protein